LIGVSDPYRVEHYPITGRWFQPDVTIDARTRNYLESGITILLAGPAAERKYAGRWNHKGAAHDRSVAADMAVRLVGSEEQLQRYWAWREQLAADLVDNPFVWEQVERLADELLGRRTMSGRAVREALRRKEGEGDVAQAQDRTAQPGDG